MKRRLLVVVAAALVLALLAGALTRAQDSDIVLTCSMGFEAAVRQGPSAGVVLLGELSFAVERSGVLTGEFALEDGQTIPVVGQVTGRLIGLVFDLGQEQYVWGTGMGLNPIVSEDCGGALGGTFAGPADGDLGDWKPKGKPGKGILN